MKAIALLYSCFAVVIGGGVVVLVVVAVVVPWLFHHVCSWLLQVSSCLLMLT